MKMFASTALLVALMVFVPLVSVHADDAPLPSHAIALPDEATINAMASAAAYDPEKYRDVLLNCAAFHGVVAVKKSNAGLPSKGHDDVAIAMMTAANIIVPEKEGTMFGDYMDRMFAFNDAIDADKSGKAERDLVQLGTLCTKVQSFAEATLLNMQATGGEAPAQTAPPVPLLDDKTREDIIAELMGTGKSEPEPAPPSEPLPPAIGLLPSEKAIIAGIFAEGTDEPSAYGGMLMDCAAYHGLRSGFERLPKKRSAHEVKENLFLEAARGVTPFAPIDADHILNVMRYKDAYASDKGGEIRKELDDLAKNCSAMEPAAQERVNIGSR